MFVDHHGLLHFLMSFQSMRDSNRDQQCVALGIVLKTHHQSHNDASWLYFILDLLHIVLLRNCMQSVLMLACTYRLIYSYCNALRVLHNSASLAYTCMDANEAYSDFFWLSVPDHAIFGASILLMTFTQYLPTYLVVQKSWSMWSAVGVTSSCIQQNTRFIAFKYFVCDTFICKNTRHNSLRCLNHEI